MTKGELPAGLPQALRPSGAVVYDRGGRPDIVSPLAEGVRPHNSKVTLDLSQLRSTSEWGSHRAAGPKQPVARPRKAQIPYVPACLGVTMGVSSSWQCFAGTAGRHGTRIMRAPAREARILRGRNAASDENRGPRWQFLAVGKITPRARARDQIRRHLGAETQTCTRDDRNRPASSDLAAATDLALFAEVNDRSHPASAPRHDRPCERRARICGS